MEIRALKMALHRSTISWPKTKTLKTASFQGMNEHFPWPA